MKQRKIFKREKTVKSEICIEICNSKQSEENRNRRKEQKRKACMKTKLLKKEKNLIDICTILEENVFQEMCRKRANYLVRSQRQH